MKILYIVLICATTFVINVAQAKIVNGELSQTNIKFDANLRQGDTLVIKYDLERKPMTRYFQWKYYVIFCYTHGQAQVEYQINSEHKIKKLPALMSKEEYGQEDIATNVDSKGELIISNLSEFYSGTNVTCGLYPKFGE